MVKNSFFLTLIIIFGIYFYPSIQAIADNKENIESIIDNFIYVSFEGEIIYNGKSLGHGINPVVEGSHYAYETIKDDGGHIIFDGEDVGIGNKPQISNGKLLYETEKDLKNSIVFDGINYGEGYDPITKDGNFIYFLPIKNEKLRDIDQGIINVYYNGTYLCSGETDIINKVKMVGDYVICEHQITVDKTKKTIVIHNRDINTDQRYSYGINYGEGYNVNISNNHYAYFKKKDFGASKKDIQIIIFDGKELGEGEDFRFSEDSFIYFRKDINGKDEIIYNGINLKGYTDKDSIIFDHGNLAFLREIAVNEKQKDGTYKEIKNIHVIYNGIDLGTAEVDLSDKTIDTKKIYLSSNHIAFERKYTATEIIPAENDKVVNIDKTGRDIAETKEIDVFYAVFDGKEITEIVEGSLKMDDTGHFGFAKFIETKEEDLDYTKERYLYYKSNKLGDSPDKDKEYKDYKKYIYPKNPYIFRGFPDGTIKKLGEGDPSTIVLQDGNVAYVKKEREEKQYYDEYTQKKRLVLENKIYINGSNKGSGDFTTIFMDNNQYSFANNINGRYFLTINGKQQLFPGREVIFLEQPSNDNEDDDKIFTLKGNLIKKEDKYYLMDNENKYRISNKGRDLQKYNTQNVIITAKKLKGIKENETIIYEIESIKLQNEEKPEESYSNKSESISIKKGDDYSGYLYTKRNKYYLKTNKGTIRLNPEKDISLDNFNKKYVNINAKKKKYQSNNSKRKYTAYQVYDIKSINEETDDDSINSKTINSNKTEVKNSGQKLSLIQSIKGLLIRDQNVFYLKTTDKTYKLRFPVSINKTDIEGYENNIITIKIKKYNEREWEIYSLPQ